MTDRRPSEAQQYLAALCYSLHTHTALIQLGVDAGAPWATIERNLSQARHFLESLVEAHNAFERVVEQRYAVDIAAAEKES